MEDRLARRGARVRAAVESRNCWVTIAKPLYHTQLEVTDCIHFRLPKVQLITNMASGDDEGVANRNRKRVVDYDRQLIL